MAAPLVRRSTRPGAARHVGTGVRSPHAATPSSTLRAGCLAAVGMGGLGPILRKTRAPRTLTTTAAAPIPLASAPPSGKILAADKAVGPTLAVPANVAGLPARAVPPLVARAVPFLAVAANLAPRARQAPLARLGALPVEATPAPALARATCAIARPNGRKKPVASAPSLAVQPAGRMADRVTVVRPVAQLAFHLVGDAWTHPTSRFRLGSLERAIHDALPFHHRLVRFTRGPSPRTHVGLLQTDCSRVSPPKRSSKACAQLSIAGKARTYKMEPIFFSGAPRFY